MVLRRHATLVFILVFLQIFSETEGGPTYTESKDVAAAEHNALRIDGKEKDNIGLVGCKYGDKILQPGEVEQWPLCARATCQEVNGSYFLEVRRCDTADEIPHNCELVPQPQKPFPECCVFVMACTYVYTPDNISELDAGDTKNIIGVEDDGTDFQEHQFDSPLTHKLANSPKSVENSPKSVESATSQNQVIPSASQKPNQADVSSTYNKSDTSTPSGLIIERKKRAISIPVDDQHIEKKVCQSENSTLEIGKSINLEGCSRMDCVEEEDGVYMVKLSCKPSQPPKIPEGCTIQARPDAKFPDCCNTVFVCVKSAVKVFPVVVTKDNISEIAINQEENFIFDNNHGFQEALSDSDALKPNLSSDSKGEELTLSSESKTQKPNFSSDSTAQKLTFSSDSKDQKPNFSSDSKDQKPNMPSHHEELKPELSSDSKAANIALSSDHKSQDPNLLSNPDTDSSPDLKPVEPNSDDVSGHLVQQRERRQLGKNSDPTEIGLLNPEHENCEVSDRVLKIGENAYFEGCREAKCILENNTTMLLVLRCPIQEEIPNNCRAVSNPELHYPACCKITLICEKFVTRPTVVPVVYTQANISLLDRNELENMIGSDATVVLNDKGITQNKTDIMDGSLQTRDVVPTDKFEVVEGCPIGNSTIGVGDIIPIQGCSQLECIRQEDELLLYLVGCDTSKTTVPVGCVIKPKPELIYPACCEVEILCEKVKEVVTPVIITAENINKLKINIKENLITKDKLVNFPTSEELATADELQPEKFVNLPISEDLATADELQPEKLVNFPISEDLATADDLHPKKLVNFHISEDLAAKKDLQPASKKDLVENKSREGLGLVRKKRAANAEDVEEDQPSCLVGNTTLDVESTLPIAGCAEVVCLPVNETLGIFIRSCAEKEVPQNCRLETEPDLKFPECCSKFMVCEEVITTTFPVVYTTANISELERNELDNMVNNHDNLNVQVGLEQTQKNQRLRRQASSSSIVKQENVGCKFGNKTLGVDESVPLQEGCAQLKCISKENDYSLVVVSCGPTESNTPEGCTLLSHTDQQYPQCCEVAYACEKVVMTVFPIVYTAANISDLERDDRINDIDSINENYKELVDNPYITLDNMHVSQSEAIKRTRVKPTPRKIERTASSVDKKLNRINVSSVRRVQKEQAVQNEKEDKGQVLLNSTSETTVKKEGTNKPQIYLNITPRVTVKKDEVDSSEPSTRRIRTRTRKQKKEKADMDKYSSYDTKKVMQEKPQRSKPRNRNIKIEQVINKPDPEKIAGTRPRSRYNFRDFYERSRRFINPKTGSESDVKPVFILPVRERIRSRIDNSNAKRDDLDALELNNSMFVTVTPNPAMTTEGSKNLKHSKKELSNEPKPSRRRGNLSALLSSRNLRTAASRPTLNTQKSDKNEKKNSRTPKKKISKIKLNKLNKKQENKPKDKQKIKEINAEKDAKPTVTISSRQRLRNRLSDGNITNTTRIAQRRRLFADRLNRFRAVVKREDSEKVSTSVDVKEKETKNVGDKHNVQKEKKEDIKTGPTKEVKSENPVPKKILLRQRLSSRRRNAATRAAEETKSSTEEPLTTSKEPPKRLSIRDRVNQEVEKPKHVGKVRIDEGYTKTRYQRRRSRPSKKVVPPKEQSITVPSQKVKARARLRNKKPVFNLNSVIAKKEDKESRPTARGRRVFDLSNVIATKKSDERKQVPVRNRVGSHSRNLRRRMKEERKQDIKEEEKKDKTQPEKTTITVTEPIVTASQDTVKPPIQTTETEEELHPYNSYDDEEVPPIYGPEEEHDYPYIPSFKSMEDFDKFYEYEHPGDLNLSSSDKESEKSPNAKENEITDDPAAPPLKITTISFTSSRRSFKSSKTSNSSKNYGETPQVYGAQETFKTTKYR